MKPNMLGSKALYLNPSWSTFTTAELAAIDTSIAYNIMSPYAYTATVRDDYDANNFCLDDASASLAAGARVAFGLFLSPDLDKGNLLFQVSGKASITGNSDTAAVHSGFFFGRKATNNTVVSSKAAASNQLAAFTMLPSQEASIGNTSGLIQLIHNSIQTEVFTLYSSGAYVYCFGFYLENQSTDAIGLDGNVSLAVRKYNTEIGVFRPSGN